VRIRVDTVDSVTATLTEASTVLTGVITAAKLAAPVTEPDIVRMRVLSAVADAEIDTAAGISIANCIAAAAVIAAVAVP
jgi:hypothetical protein